MRVNFVFLISFLFSSACFGWGTLAFELETSRWGISFDHQDIAAADSAAINACAGKSCKVIENFQNECESLSLSPEGVRAWGIGKEASKELAESTAIKQCKRFGDHCAVAVSACDGKLRPSSKERKNKSTGGVPEECKPDLDRLTQILSAVAAGKIREDSACIPAFSAGLCLQQNNYRLDAVDKVLQSCEKTSPKNNQCSSYKNAKKTCAPAPNFDACMSRLGYAKDTLEQLKCANPLSADGW